MTDDWAQTAADEIIDNLRGRRGISHAFDGIDREIQVEIRERWAAIIRKVAQSDQPR